MPDHHPHHTQAKATPAQQRFLRQLAERTGTSFTPPRTKVEAVKEIQRLLARERDPRADQIRDRRAVQQDLQAGAGDAVRIRAGETTGFGSSARWAHGHPEADR